MHSRIAGTGSYLPAEILTNEALAARVATSDDWIRTRTGIRQRHIAAQNERTSDLALAASRQALDDAALAGSDIDLVIVATTTPDAVFPSTACTVQAGLGAHGGPAFDVQAVCSGFIYALSVADAMIKAGSARRALVIGAEVFSRLLDFDDRTTCVLFGDGAGAVVIEASDQPRGLLSLTMGADGGGAGLLKVPGLGSAMPASPEVLERHDQYIKMEGSEVFKLAVRVMGDASIEAIARAGMQFREIDILFPHQANLRIIEATAKRLDMPREKVWVNIERYGNTSAATIPISLSEAAEQGLLHEGSNLLLVAFGGGLTWAASVVRWGRGCEGGDN
jgi:3-oxoacyl-[acyl-carrier-protein] synthase-3